MKAGRKRNDSFMVSLSTEPPIILSRDGDRNNWVICEGLVENKKHRMMFKNPAYFGNNLESALEYAFKLSMLKNETCKTLIDLINTSRDKILSSIKSALIDIRKSFSCACARE